MNQQQRLIELGKAIRQVRLAAGLTQQQLGAKCGYDATYISMVERGRRNPPFLTLCSIARHLGISLHKLLRQFNDR
jgi:transcriptional regulator with XRE-family HTH domain